MSKRDDNTGPLKQFIYRKCAEVMCRLVFITCSPPHPLPLPLPLSLSKYLRLHETPQWDADTRLTGEISTPPSAEAQPLTAINCVRNKVSALRRFLVSHEYAKRRVCQAAKSWRGAELAQHGPSLFYRSDSLLLEESLYIYLIYQGGCSGAYECLAHCLHAVISLCPFHLFSHKDKPHLKICTWQISFWKSSYISPCLEMLGDNSFDVAAQVGEEFFPFFYSDETIDLSQCQITKTISAFVFQNIVKGLKIHLRLWAFVSQTRRSSFELRFVCL